MIEAEPSFGYRTVASLLRFNKNTVQRLFQLFGWQVKKRPIGFRLLVQALPSVAQAPNQRWATDLCRIWVGRDGWAVLALVIDCYTRELLGWHLSRSGKAKTTESALEQALIARYWSLRCHSSYVLIMAWSSPAEATLLEFEVMACNRSSLHRIVHNKMAWSSASFALWKNNALIDIVSKVCSTLVGLVVTGLAFTITNDHIKRWP